MNIETLFGKCPIVTGMTVTTAVSNLHMQVDPFPGWMMLVTSSCTVECPIGHLATLLGVWVGRGGTELALDSGHFS